MWEAAKVMRDNFSKKICLAPEAWRTDCSRQIVKAHTVPRSSSLKEIARDGHVYAFDFSVEGLEKNNGIAIPSLRGIGNASTFSGFCSTHDNSIFAPLEKGEFTASQEQCFLLSYRAFTREVYTKRAMADGQEFIRNGDRGKSIVEQQEHQATHYFSNIGISAGVRDNEQRKALFDLILDKRSFESVRAYVIELQSPPPVMLSGSFSPEQDFEGNALQDLGDLTRLPDLISANAFSGGDKGVIVFSWLAEEKASCDLAQSLSRIPDLQLTDALLRLFLESCENLHMQPEWWEGLSESQRTALINRMDISANPEVARDSSCLRDDGVRVMPWTVQKRYWVGPT